MKNVGIVIIDDFHCLDEAVQRELADHLKLLSQFGFLLTASTKVPIKMNVLKSGAQHNRGFPFGDTFDLTSSEPSAKFSSSTERAMARPTQTSLGPISWFSHFASTTEEAT
jgi:hypothetical protein